MAPDNELLRELTRVVWTTVLGLEASERPSLPPETGELTTSVDITGAWEGTVSLSFSRVLGNRLAAAMLDCPESETTPELVADVVGELANVLGGNVKGTMPGPCTLSLPRVETTETSLAGHEICRRVWFDCEGNPFNVTVHSRPSEPGVSHEDPRR